VLSYCLLSWAGQRAPVYFLYTSCRSLSCHVVPPLAASFLVSLWLWENGKVLLIKPSQELLPGIHGAIAKQGP